MKETDYLKLKKPDYADPADIMVVNENMDKIDEKVEKIGTGFDNAEIDTNAALPTKVSEAIGSIIQTLGWFGNMLKTITGKTYWWQKPKLNIEEISASLDNKVNIPIRLEASMDLNNITTPGMYYCAANVHAASITNAPVARAFSLLVEKHAGAKQTFTQFWSNDPITFVRNLNEGIWGAWKQIAIVEKPTQYPLPLRSGFSSLYGLSCYYKDDFGQVTIHFAIKKSGTSNDLGDTPFADLPVGFRPSSHVYGAIGASTTALVRTAGWAYVDSTGKVSLNLGNNFAETAFGTLTFPIA